MELFAQAGAVTDVTPDQLRGYMAERDEREYQLVDVRQPEEYQQGHIPGALLIPVGEFESRRAEVERLADRKAIFYCRSGVRSSRAAAWASQVSELPEVFNLLGGFSAWGGVSIPDFPRLKALDLDGRRRVAAAPGLRSRKGNLSALRAAGREVRRSRGGGGLATRQGRAGPRAGRASSAGPGRRGRGARLRYALRTDPGPARGERGVVRRSGRTCAGSGRAGRGRDSRIRRRYRAQRLRSLQEPRRPALPAKRPGPP